MNRTVLIRLEMKPGTSLRQTTCSRRHESRKNDILRILPTNEKYEHLNEDVTVNDFDIYCKEIFSPDGSDSDIGKLCKKLARNYKRIAQTKREEREDICLYFKYWLHDEVRKLSKSEVSKKYVSGINNKFQKVTNSICHEFYDCPCTYIIQVDFLDDWQEEKNLHDYFKNLSILENKIKSPGINSQSYHEYVSYINDLYKKHIDENDCCTVWEDCTRYINCDDEAIPEKLLDKIILPKDNSDRGTETQDSGNIISTADSSFLPSVNRPQEIDKTLEGRSLEALKTRGPHITEEEPECSNLSSAENPHGPCSASGSFEKAIGARGASDSHVKDMATGLQSVNDPHSPEFDHVLLPTGNIENSTTTEEKPYILQNKYARVAYAMTLTMAVIYLLFFYGKRTPLKFSFLKKIFKRKRDKNKLRRKYENEIISYDLEDVYINSYNIPLHLRYYQT
ncbi:PIR Superfamily Protein [Plasmodium ovale wallikeri]|uniref:PIR Superfamily Protein n=1 Tax=Plasmodium ovale wallikeri TaxID=864142 RepID=A0A1A9AIR7_PLAOA|nr:PIR Superfamily Protein [Plasmodium ovale wallikeri]